MGRVSLFLGTNEPKKHGHHNPIGKQNDVPVEPRRMLVRLVFIAHLLLMLGTPRAVDATGLGVCTISGYIHYTFVTDDYGTWDLYPAVIDCHGLFRGTDRIVGPGRFQGQGTFTLLQSNSFPHGRCVSHLGQGTVDYWLPTQNQDVHTVEQYNYLAVEAGTVITPSFQGALHAARPCGSVAQRTLYLAEVVMLRPPYVS